MTNDHSNSNSNSSDDSAVVCPKCGSTVMYVIKSTKTPSGAIRRRRECRYCKSRITTYEGRNRWRRAWKDKYL